MSLIFLNFFLNCRTPSPEDLIDDKFIDEARFQNEGAMYKILNGVFKDPFIAIRPRPPPNTQENTSTNNPSIKRRKRKAGRGKKKPI